MGGLEKRRIIHPFSMSMVRKTEAGRVRASLDTECPAELARSRDRSSRRKTASAETAFVGLDRLPQAAPQSVGPRKCVRPDRRSRVSHASPNGEHIVFDGSKIHAADSDSKIKARSPVDRASTPRRRDVAGVEPEAEAVKHTHCCMLLGKGTALIDARMFGRLAVSTPATDSIPRGVEPHRMSRLATLRR